MKEAFLDLDVEEEEDSYEIVLNSEATLFFTQTHTAEIQELLRLIDEYGLPNDETVTDEGIPNTVHEEQVIKDGSHITYRKVQTGQSVNAIIQAGKFPLHELMVGKKVGDVVSWMGKKYEIIVIL